MTAVILAMSQYGKHVNVYIHSFCYVFCINSTTSLSVTHVHNHIINSVRVKLVRLSIMPQTSPYIQLLLL